VTGAPVASLLLGGVVYSFLTLRGFTDLINIYVFLQAAYYVMIYLTLLRLRARFPDARRPFKIAGGRWGLALVVTPPMLLLILVVWKGDPRILVQGLVAIAVGPVVYLLAQVARRPQAPPSFES
jgi:amino acid transporter